MARYNLNKLIMMIDETRAEENALMPGLPPVSPFFVKRKKPTEALADAFRPTHRLSQKIMVISGLGGIGKTQLVLKFARDYRYKYRHVQPAYTLTYV